MNWNQYIKSFKNYLKLEKSLSKNSIEAYLADVEKLTQFVDSNFSYNSGDNEEWETIESLRELVKIHVDPNFTVL